MQVRQANSNDLSEFVRLANLFLKESSYPFKINLNKLVSSFSQGLEDENFLILVLEDEDKLRGMLVGAIAQPLFSDEMISTELAWFVEKDFRKSTQSMKLLKVYEGWAKARGCSFVTMMDIDSLNDLHNLYERMGYKLTEKTYVKEI